MTLAIGLHNVPEGLAVATVLSARGIPPRQALLWTLATALPQPLVALPSFLFVDTFSALLPVALGFAAGCMIWMVFAELLPDALADASSHTQARLSCMLKQDSLKASCCLHFNAEHDLHGYFGAAALANMSYLHRGFIPSSLAHKPVRSWLAGREDRVDWSENLFPIPADPTPLSFYFCCAGCNRSDFLGGLAGGPADGAGDAGEAGRDADGAHADGRPPAARAVGAAAAGRACFAGRWA